MGKINVLSFEVANLIAAGEVVDRPASAIKEMIENSIDAGAKHITVEIQNGGISFMRISDDGCGMEPSDMPLAIRRHATSKIKNAEDLDGILTLGFRGEALAAISAVSNVRIISKTKESPLGAELVADYGEVVEFTERGCSDGTTIIVENLFANVPARRKFLKRDVTETTAVTANVERIALSHPNIAFRLICDGQLKLDTAGDGNLKSTIYSVFGRDFSNRLLEVEGDFDGVAVSGYVGRSDNVKGNRNYQNFYINKRYIKSRTASAALEQAFVSYLPSERFPVCVLFITLNPQRVDVNVHPAKLEVKFSNEKPVFESVYYAVRQALENNTARPEMELPRTGTPSGVRMSDAFVPVEREKSLKARQISIDVTKPADPKVQSYPRPTVQHTDIAEERNVPGANDAKIVAETVEQTHVEKSNDSQANIPDSGESTSVVLQNGAFLSDVEDDYGITKITPEQYIRQYLAFGETPEGKKFFEIMERADEGMNPPPDFDLSAIGDKFIHFYQTADSADTEKTAEAEAAQNPESITSEHKREVGAKPETLVGQGDAEGGDTPAVTSAATAESPEPEQPASVDYRIVGEVFNSYVILETGEKMLLIDKHAAHERIIFEQLKKNMYSAQISSQLLMLPIEIMLMTDEISAIEEYRSEIESTGFEFSTSRNTLSVTALPTGVEQDAVPDMFAVMADRIKSGTGRVDITRNIVFEKALYQASCKAAIKAGREYAKGHIEWLVDKLMSIPDITVCPHGRPVAMEMSKKNIDRQFERT